MPPLTALSYRDADGNPVAPGENGEICIRVGDKAPCGLFLGYYRNQEKTDEVLHDGLYHTGDTAWCDEDGFFWYVGRVDDVIKSSGYRIGPFEIENVIMELPYVLECGVSAAPDELRGQVVKASIVLTKGTEPTEELKKEIQNYVKEKTAPYKYPRIIEFKKELPKTIVATGMKIGETAKNIKNIVDDKMETAKLYEFQNDKVTDLVPELAKGYASELAVTTPKMVSDMAYWVGTNMKDPTGKKSNALSDTLLSISESMRNVSEYMGDVDLLKSKVKSTS